MYAVGQHSTQKNLIELTSFQVASGHQLTPLNAHTFDMEAPVVATSISSERAEDYSSYSIRIAYHATSGADVGEGKVLHVILLADGSVVEAKTYIFTSSNDPGSSTIVSVQQHGTSTILYSGHGNYLEDSSSGFGTLKVDWMESDDA